MHRAPRATPELPINKGISLAKDSKNKIKSLNLSCFNYFLIFHGINHLVWGLNDIPIQISQLIFCASKVLETPMPFFAFFAVGTLCSQHLRILIQPFELTEQFRASFAVIKWQVEAKLKQIL